MSVQRYKYLAPFWRAYLIVDHRNKPQQCHIKFIDIVNRLFSSINIQPAAAAERHNTNCSPQTFHLRVLKLQKNCSIGDSWRGEMYHVPYGVLMSVLY